MDKSFNFLGVDNELPIKEGHPKSMALTAREKRKAK